MKSIIKGIAARRGESIPLSLIPLKALACIESIAADAIAVLHSICFFRNKDRQYKVKILPFLVLLLFLYMDSQHFIIHHLKR